MLSVGQKLGIFQFAASGFVDGTVELLPLAAAVGIKTLLDINLPIFVACFGCIARPGYYCPPGLLMQELSACRGCSDFL